MGIMEYQVGTGIGIPGTLSTIAPSSVYYEVTAQMAEIQESIEKLRLEVKGDIEGVRSDMKRLEDSMRSDMKRLEDSMRSDIRHVESSMKGEIGEAKSDLRKILYALVGGGIGLAALMAHGFKWF